MKGRTDGRMDGFIRSSPLGDDLKSWTQIKPSKLGGNHVELDIQKDADVLKVHLFSQLLLA